MQATTQCCAFIFCVCVQSATQQILEQAEPIAKDITRGVIAPGATEIRKNAVPITEEVCPLNLVLLSACLALDCAGSCDVPLSVH